METTPTTETDPRRDTLDPRAASVRRRIRARYPILKDGAVLLGPPDEAAPPQFPRNLVREARAAVPALRADRPSVQDWRRLAPSAAPAHLARPQRLRALLHEIDRRALPHESDRTELVLMEAAPRKVFAYWQVPESTLHRARQRLAGGEDAELVLRFYDITSLRLDGTDWNHTFDIPLEADETSRYIEFWSADRAYVVDLGLAGPAGDFAPLARSNRVRLPREEPGPGTFETLLVPENRIVVPAPERPEPFRPPEAPVIVSDAESDSPERDLMAETAVRATYLAFLREGPRALRRDPVRPRPADLLRSEYESRAARRADRADEAGRLSPAPPAERTGGNGLFMARLDAGTAVRPPEASEGASGARAAPPAPRPKTRHEPARVERAVLELLQRSCATARAARAPVPAKPPPAPLPEPAEEEPATVVDFGDTIELSDILADEGIRLEAELVLRGRVPGGRNLRIGGTEIRTGRNGDFRLSCRFRRGRLQIPVEVVEAEEVVARDWLAVSLGSLGPDGEGASRC
jgi:hypothetical protein